MEIDPKNLVAFFDDGFEISMTELLPLSNDELIVLREAHNAESWKFYERKA
jgi:hypothetical protein